MPTNENPQFGLMVGTKMLNVGVTQLVEKVSFEDTDGIADRMTLIIKNPDNVISDNKIFAWGNEVSVFMGYAGKLHHVGRSRIYKAKPYWPDKGMPFIEITGYTRDHEMMHNSPPQASSRGRTGGKLKGAKRQQSQAGRQHKQKKFSEAVKSMDYPFEFDVDDTPDAPSDFIQKPGMSDYDFVNGMANITGYVFWVDGTADGTWTLHFKDPEKLKEQDTTFTFERNIGNATTLLTFEPEFLVSEAVGHFRVRVLNAADGKVIDIDVSEDSLSGSPELESDDPTAPKSDKIDKSPEQSLSVQLYIGDYTFYEVTNRKFTTAAELTKWAKQWFRRNRDNYIYAEAGTIGVPGIRSRQVHKIKGAGTVYDGNYYMSRVEHVCDSKGYTLNFTCRKQTSKVGF